MRYHARWVLPIGAPPLRDATVAVIGDRIAWVGPRHDAPPGEAASGPETDLGDAILLPGLVNAHIHLDLAHFDGALSDRRFFPWVRALVRGLAEATDGVAQADVALWSVADQLAHGVTTMGDTSPGRASFDALRRLGARGVAYLEAFSPHPAGAADASADLRRRVEAARRDETGHVRIGVSPHAPYSVCDELYAAVAEYARTESLPVAVHIAESPAESALVAGGEGPFAALLRERGIGVAPRAGSPIALLERLGVLATRPLCIHAVRADAHDARRLADAGAAVAHCPLANRWFGHGAAPVGAYRALGVPVALGTDSAAGNDGVRLLAEAAAAEDATLSAAERIALATRGGARALGLAGAVGELRAGLQADLAAFAVDDPVACDADPEGYLLDHRARAPAVRTVVAGVERAAHGRVHGLDPGVEARMAGHRARVRRWAERQVVRAG